MGVPFILGLPDKGCFDALGRGIIGKVALV
jgi:hypothetical protein